MTGGRAFDGGTGVGAAATGGVDDVDKASPGADVGVVAKAGIPAISGRAGLAVAAVGREKATLSAKRACSSRATRSGGVVTAVVLGGRSGSPRAGLDGPAPVLGATASLVRCNCSASAARRCVCS